ncbi:MAG: MtnX-like HAD-IB family phosphatase [Thermaerobacter sp.]|nr:MtnX-like HAD-IB family phosphatase [Thermaerobacter sp.]
MAFVLDFDGTLSPVDVGETLLVRYGGVNQARAQRLWREGRLGSKAMHLRQYPLLSGRRAAVDAFVDGVALDEGLSEFQEVCRRLGARILVVSDGMDYYIRRILDRHGLADAQVYANHLEFVDGRVALAFPHENPWCDRCANCKGALVRDLRREGWRVAYVGNGLSDRFAAPLADRIFAKDELAAELDRDRISYTPFATFRDVAAAIEREGVFPPRACSDRGDPPVCRFGPGY